MKLVVDGMTCGHCVRTVTGVITQLDPAATVAVDLGTGEVTINGKVELAAAVKAIADEGYPVVAILEAGATGSVEPDPRPSCCGTCTPESAVSLL